MKRLDARVITNLPARALYLHRSERVEESVTVRDISLGGALVQGLGRVEPGGSWLSLRSELPREGEVEFQGTVVRKQDGFTAMKFFTPSLPTARSLWKHIRRDLGHADSCPYCRQATLPTKDNCPGCSRFVAFDNPLYIEKHLAQTMEQRIQGALRGLGLSELQTVLSHLEQVAAKNLPTVSDIGLVGCSVAMRSVFDQIDSLASGNANVLILGAPGTEKSQVARAIHNKSARKLMPFLELGVVATPEAFLEPELFGYQKGAFRQAGRTQKGLLEAADGGSVFIDDMGSLSPSLQARLFCFFKDGIVERLGTKGGKRVDVRVFGGLPSAPKALVEADTFLSNMDPVTLELPVLKDRGEDVVLLAESFLRKFAAEKENAPEGFAPDALKVIREKSWDGNLLELERCIRDAVALAAGPQISASDLGVSESCGKTAEKDLRTELARSQKEQVAQALESSGFVIAHAAKVLGISRPSLYSLMRKHNIRKPH